MRGNQTVEAFPTQGIVMTEFMLLLTRKEGYTLKKCSNPTCNNYIESEVENDLCEICNEVDNFMEDWGEGY